MMSSLHGNNKSRILYHLARASVWKSAKKHRRPYEPPSFQTDGFIQACEDDQFLRNIADKRHSRRQGGDFMILEIDTEHPDFNNMIVFVPQPYPPLSLTINSPRYICI